MAKKFKGKKKEKRGAPPYNIQLSRKVGEEYKRVSMTGLWKAGKDAPDGVVLGGSMSGEYLEKAAEFLVRAAKKDATVYLNVWNNEDGKGGSKKKRDEDDDEDEEKDEDDEDNEDGEDDEDDDEAPF